MTQGGIGWFPIFPLLEKTFGKGKDVYNTKIGNIDEYST